MVSIDLNKEDIETGNLDSDGSDCSDDASYYTTDPKNKGTSPHSLRHSHSQLSQASDFYSDIDEEYSADAVYDEDGMQSQGEDEYSSDADYSREDRSFHVQIRPKQGLGGVGSMLRGLYSRDDDDDDSDISSLGHDATEIVFFRAEEEKAKQRAASLSPKKQTGGTSFSDPVENEKDASPQKSSPRRKKDKDKSSSKKKKKKDKDSDSPKKKKRDKDKSSPKKKKDKDKSSSKKKKEKMKNSSPKKESPEKKSSVPAESTVPLPPTPDLEAAISAGKTESSVTQRTTETVSEPQAKNSQRRLMLILFFFFLGLLILGVGLAVIFS